MTYAYDEVFSHMMQCKISPWTNNWTDVFDFTPQKKSPTGEPNWFTEADPLVENFMRPLEHAKEIMAKAEGEPKSLAEVDPEVQAQIIEEYEAAGGIAAAS